LTARQDLVASDTNSGRALSETGDGLGHFRFSWNQTTDTGTVTTLSSSNLSTGTWYHAVAVRDDSAQTISLYVNGVLEGFSSDADSTAVMTGFRYLGTSDPTNPSLAFSGKLDEIGFFNRALSPAEVQSLYNGDVKLSGRQENNTYILSDANATGTVDQTWLGAGDTMIDTLGFSNFHQAGVNIDISQVTPQNEGPLTLQLTDGMGISNVIGTQFIDTIIGNGRNNVLQGAAYSQSGTMAPLTAAANARTQWVLVDFDTYTSGTALHVYTQDERQAVVDQMNEYYRGSTDPNSVNPWYDVRVVQDVPTSLSSPQDVPLASISVSNTLGPDALNYGQQFQVSARQIDGYSTGNSDFYRFDAAKSQLINADAASEILDLSADNTIDSTLILRDVSGNVLVTNYKGFETTDA
jgi:hypothetical protein